MTNQIDDLLFDEPLVPNLDADAELSGDRVPALSEDEIFGARMRLLRKTIERIEDGDGIIVALTAEFHPAPATRFTHATVSLVLTEPENALVIEVAPVEVRTKDPITFKVSRSGKISFEKVVTAEMGTTREMNYSVYPCLVRGSGKDSQFATWTFEEHTSAGDGIGQAQDLILTLAGVGPFQAEVRVSARLLKPGLPGAIQRARDLVFGPKLKTGTIRPVTFTVPPTSQRSGFFGFFR